MKDSAELLGQYGRMFYDHTKLCERAAVLAQNPVVKAALEELTGERLALYEEIEERLEAAGGEPVDRETFLGAAHEALMEARAIVDDDTHAALSEVQRGEDHLWNELDAELNSDFEIAQDLRDFLERLVMRMEPGRARVAALHASMHNPS